MASLGSFWKRLFASTSMEEQVIAYLTREHARGRRVSEILQDRYIQNRLTPQQQNRLLDRPDAPPSGPLSVATPFGLIAARGTKFFAGPSQGTFGVFVEHGLVTVRTRVGAVTLTNGFYSVMLLTQFLS